MAIFYLLPIFCDKRNMKKLSLLFTLLFLLSLLSCEINKYESGPNVSVFTPRERVTNTWRWKLALEGNENKTGILQDSTLTFTKDQVVKICGPDGGCREGSWDLVRKNTKINLIFGNNARAYDLELLKINEMWLRSDADGSSPSVEWDLVPVESE